VLVALNAQKLFTSRDYRNAGVSRYIGEIARRLPGVPGDERFVLYTNQAVRDWPGSAGGRLRIRPSRLPTTSPVLRILWEQTALALLALRDRAHVLHCPLNVRPVVSSPPVVLTIHDLTFLHVPERFGRLRQRYLASLTRYSARRSEQILADSLWTKLDVQRCFDVRPELVHVVYPGVDQDFRPLDRNDPDDVRRLSEFRRKHGLPERIVLYLGTLEPRKNVDKLVEAFAALVRRGVPHALVLAGGKGWHYEAIFRAVEAHGLQRRVVVPGYIERAEQPLWYNAADLFVYPSQYEGFGLPPLEAMACGVPVVTSNASSLPEVVGGAGTTVDPTDVEALTEAMAQTLGDPGRAESLAAAGRAWADRFTWSAAAEGCVAAYRRAAAGAGRRRRILHDAQQSGPATRPDTVRGG
jgi:glycosyltransferase involved in cell wall biosynthesis